MKKQEILELLDKAKYWEDEFILNYDREDFQELLKSLPKKKYEKIKILLDKNINDTKYHKKALEKIIKNAKDGIYEL